MDKNEFKQIFFELLDDEDFKTKLQDFILATVNEKISKAAETVEESPAVAENVETVEESPAVVENADSEKISELENELHNTFGEKNRSDLAIKISQEILNDCAVFYAAHLKMSFVMKKNIEGFSAHPSDYYEITPALEKK